MLKKLGVTLIAGSLMVGMVPASGEAANLSRLLGAQRATVTRTAADRGERRTVRSTPAEKPQAKAPKKAAPTLGSLHHTTPRFPLLRKLIKLYLAWLLLNPYR